MTTTRVIIEKGRNEASFGIRILYSPDILMKPERAGTLELGLSTRKKGLWKDNDTDRRFFYDFSATYYLKAKTCDAAFAAELRAQSHPFAPDTPDCADGGFMGSYSTTQNPPKYSVNLTAGFRFLQEKLTLGGRIMHTDRPISRLDKPWHNGNTTWQVPYQPTTLLDAFLKYRLRKDLMLSVALHNITNRYYLDPLAQSFMPGPGRTLRVGMQIKF